jgi:rod shape determining protein RodA
VRPSWRRLDVAQPAAALLLATAGVMTIYSAGADWKRQLVWIALGALAFAASAWFDYRRIAPFALAIYAAMILLLVAVHLVGRTALGAQRWLSVGGFPLEPSELSKLMLVVVLAALMSHAERLSWRRFAVVLMLTVPPAALILTQPDLGTAIVFVAVLLGMLFLGGARPGQLASLAIVALGAIPLLPYVLHGYQRRRLEVFLNPGSDPQGAGYNLLQARIAVGSGGLFGRGWLHGLQGQLGFVPERATDFIFAIFAEQFGLLGCLILLAIFGALLIRILKVSALAADRFGELVAGGVFLVVFVQVVQNVGMNIGALPIAGIPLPLISYGGSATITTFAALGLVQSVVVRRRTVVHHPQLAHALARVEAGSAHRSGKISLRA